MAQNILIYDGSPGVVSGNTPFGLYDSDSAFTTDARNVTDWCAQRLGYPVTDVELNDTVQNIKRRIEEREGYVCVRMRPSCKQFVFSISIPKENQRLIFKGQKLEDDRTVADYQIETESILHLVLRITGKFLGNVLHRYRDR